MPQCHLFNRQRKVKVDLPWLRAFAKVALAGSQGHTFGSNPLLAILPEVEVSIVSDRAIAKVHGEFLEDPTPTDVITFEHGEILVSADTALFNSRRFGTELQAELGLYVIHGFLHLNGFLDEDPADAARMHSVQNEILKSCLGTMDGSARRRPSPTLHRSDRTDQTDPIK
jgi:probable rRNA maturation factor